MCSHDVSTQVLSFLSILVSVIRPDFLGVAPVSTRFSDQPMIG